MKNAFSLTALIALTLVALVATMTSAPVSATQGVSPGETDYLSITNDLCPTFSWQGDDEAMLYEIVGYSLHTDEDPSAAKLAAENEVFYTRVPAGATSWTPSAQQCVSAGGRYVWFVRPVIEAVGDQVIDAGEWSEGRYFQVPAGPSEAEVAKAIDVLKRWEATNGGGGLQSSAGTRSGGASPTLRRYGTGSARADAGTDAGWASPKSVPTAEAAIRGEHPDISGEGYGVVGTSASADGAGVAAANLDGGPDLLLDGSADGEPDTVVWQGGVDRTSATHQTFTMGNSGAGRLHLTVDGDLTSNVVRTEEVVVNGVTVIDDVGDWLGNGSTVPCVGCVTSSDLEDGGVGAADIADGEIGYTKLSAQGGYTGQVLKVNGISVVWADDADGELSIPYAGGGTNSETNFYMANSGSGWAIHAEAAQNNAIVGDAWHNGTGVLGRQMLASSSGAGVVGQTYSNDGYGVMGSGAISAPDATGVKGVSESGTGVAGVSDSGAGVFGTSSSGAGVQGEADTGHGVYGISRGYGVSNPNPAAGVHGVIDESGVTGVGVLGERDSNTGALGVYDAGVEGSAASGHGVIARSSGNGLVDAALYAVSEGPAGIAIRAHADSTDAAMVVGNEGTGEIVKLFNGGNLRARMTSVGDFYIDGAYFSGGADFAELLPAYSDDLEPGDVLAIAADGRLMKSQRAYQASVVGVYSTKPGILGGSGIDGDTAGKIPLAVVGVVPVKTCDENGPVRPGDMLVSSSIPGHAMSAGDRAPNGRVIGKALSGLEAGRGEITMLVILQ